MQLWMFLFYKQAFESWSSKVDNNLLAEESHRKTLLETLSKNYNDLFDKLSAIALDFEKAKTKVTQIFKDKEYSLHTLANKL